MTTLLVIGGSGFLGQQICRIAVSRGINVCSLSSHGMPNFGNIQPQWASQVQWTVGDVFEPHTYKDQLSVAAKVVHTVGILLETDYKDAFSGKENPFAAISRIGKLFLGTDRNPLVEKPKTLQYEYMNKKAAIIAAEASSKHPNIDTFIMISAAGSFPGLPERYFTSKREAEEHISKLQSFRFVSMRPGFMYSPSRPMSIPVSLLVGAVSGITRGRLSCLGAAGTKPLSVTQVAAATVEAALSDSVSGVVQVPEIENLACSLA